MSDDARGVKAPRPSPIQTIRTVNTEPKSRQPAERLVAAAERDLPSVLNNAQHEPGIPIEDGERSFAYVVLRRDLMSEGHKRDAAEWAIHRHAQAGRLVIEPGCSSAPCVYIPGTSDSAKSTKSKSYDRERCYLRATANLWARCDQETHLRMPTAEENKHKIPLLDLLTKSEIPEALQVERNESPVRWTVEDVRELLAWLPHRDLLLKNASQTALAILGAQFCNDPTIAIRAMPYLKGLIKPKLSESEAEQVLAFVSIRGKAKTRFSRTLDVEGFDEMTVDVANVLGVTLDAVREMDLDRFVLHLGRSGNAQSIEVASAEQSYLRAKIQMAQRSTKLKKSTAKGDAEAKLIATLTKHHQYANNSCLNLDSIGNNDLARQSEVDKATASAFFERKFQGHAKYKVMCRDASKLVAAIKLLNAEFAPHHLDGRRPLGENDEAE